MLLELHRHCPFQAGLRRRRKAVSRRQDDHNLRLASDAPSLTLSEVMEGMSVLYLGRPDASIAMALAGKVGPQGRIVIADDGEDRLDTLAEILWQSVSGRSGSIKLHHTGDDGGNDHDLTALGPFDLIAINGLSRFDDLPTDLISDWTSVLRPGGRMILTAPGIFTGLRRLRRLANRALTGELRVVRRHLAPCSLAVILQKP